MIRVLVVIGPTAVGKSQVGIQLAQQYNGEIISGDSIQVYRQLNIGSAKVSKEQQKMVVHHLIDTKDISENYHVAAFQNESRKIISELNKNAKLPIIVGGTGLYIKAALYDYQFNEEEKLDFKLESLTNEQLKFKLTNIDPQTAEIIHINNRKRLLRALQMAMSGNKRSDVLAKQAKEPIYDCLLIGLTCQRDILYQRIESRIDTMIKEGLFEEVDELYQNDHALFDYQALQAIGYREWRDYYQNKFDKEVIVNNIKLHTRQFAKRQYTWFNNQLPVKWFDINDDTFMSNIHKEVKEWLNNG
ncbi:MAG: tRNA (adenosine(37)-N6)-dimethylallyltransferase MiaA [Erysipelotrichaceae bacterium]|nr:tRNA (adenosine(37)-N6)-dimethylallyltransferase MiaA [Erysipelotrichaceae bacterium]